MSKRVSGWYGPAIVGGVLVSGLAASPVVEAVQSKIPNVPHPRIIGSGASHERSYPGYRCDGPGHRFEQRFAPPATDRLSPERSVTRKRRGRPAKRSGIVE
jgi:hypothetical protein